jgi:peptidoglycan/xylan/chitin deacetylase (PgdA/CDA1 family)
MTAKDALKSVLLLANRYSGAESLRDHRWQSRRVLPATVLCFHRVTDKIPEDAITITTARFRGIVRRLAAEYRVVPYAEIVADLYQQRQWPPRTVAITFDDGYLDNFVEAAPILAEHDLHATFFCAADLIGSNTVLPWDEPLRGRVPWMTWDQVRQLQDQGFEIGSHTLSHCDLGQVRGAEAKRELVESKRKLEERLGRAVPLFAYPFGGPANLLEENLQLVREAGYTACCSAHGGLVLPASDPFRIHRVPVNNWFQTVSSLEFEMRSGAFWRWSQPA